MTQNIENFSTEPVKQVGDPGRAEFIGSSLLRDLELRHEHRGLVTLTGTSEIIEERATIISPVKTAMYHLASKLGLPHNLWTYHSKKIHSGIF